MTRWRMSRRIVPGRIVSGGTMTGWILSNGSMARGNVTGHGPGRVHRSARTCRPNLPSRLRRLSGVRAKQTILKRRAIEPPDDRIHFFRIRRFDECETFRLLRFRITDYLNCVRNQALGRQPSPDIVRSHPSGQIAQKDGETHSEIIFNSIRGDCFVE